MAKTGRKILDRPEPLTTNESGFDDWLKAVDEFTQWKQQLDSVMDTYEATTIGGQAAKNSLVTADLRRLVRDLNQMMKTLLSQTKSMERLGEAPLSILALHAQTLSHWSKIIQRALTRHAVKALS